MDNADGGAKGVAQARADESVDQVVLSAVMAQVAQLSREVEGLREARVEKRTRVETVEKKEEVSVLDVVFRPTMWTRAVLDGAESPAEAVARVDTLVMAIDRHYRIGDLRANGLPANASAGVGSSASGVVKNRSSPRGRGGSAWCAATARDDTL